jgi:diguanylate cyclase
VATVTALVGHLGLMALVALLWGAAARDRSRQAAAPEVPRPAGAFAAVLFGLAAGLAAASPFTSPTFADAFAAAGAFVVVAGLVHGPATGAAAAAIAILADAAAGTGSGVAGALALTALVATPALSDRVPHRLRIAAAPAVAAVSCALLTPTAAAAPSLALALANMLLSVDFALALGLMVRRERRRIAAEDGIRQLAYCDELTGLRNRRFFHTELNAAWRRYARHGTPFSLLLVDIDHFKSINDRYGHLAGDEAIRTLARLMREDARGSDVAARIGGEEFALILSNTTADRALLAAERLRARIEASPVEHEGKVVRMSASFGVGIPRPGGSVEAIVAGADQALYAAKRAGRNRVMGPPEALAAVPSSAPPQAATAAQTAAVERATRLRPLPRAAGRARPR